MNMKKLIAGVVASVMAVGTMAVAASAASDKYVSTYTRTFTADKINTVDEGFWATAMTGAIAHGITFEGTYTDADGNTGNILFYPSWDGTGDVGDGKITINATDMWQGVTICFPESVDVSDPSAISVTITVTALDIDADAQVQIDSYGEEGNDHVVGDMVVAKIGVNTSYADGFGGILVEALPTEDAGNDDGGAASDDNGGTDGAGTDDKTTPDTGVEGVAVVAGLAIVAAGAVVVAKKRG